MSHTFITQADSVVFAKRKNRKYELISYKIAELERQYLNRDRTRLSFLKACSAAIGDSITKLQSAETAETSRSIEFPEIPLNVFDSAQVASVPSNSAGDNSSAVTDVAYPSVHFTCTVLNTALQLYLCSRVGLTVCQSLYNDFDNRRTVNRFQAPHQFDNHAVVPVVGDGNCLFRALSFIISGTEIHHHHLRTLICNYISCHYRNIPGASENYVRDSRMANASVWATDVELHAAAALLGVNIYVYSTYGVQRCWLLHRPYYASENEDRCSIFINHRNGNHYEPVIF